MPLRSVLAPASVPIVAQAAAARHGIAIAVDEHAIAQMAENPVALMRLATLKPVAEPGQYLLLDAEERQPEDRDLVVVETDTGRRYARRFWQQGDLIYLEAQNATTPYYAPEVLTGGICRTRRIVGVMFEPCRACGPAKVGEEWAAPSGGGLGLLDKLIGVRVEGTSLEPVAWDGQVALVRRGHDRSAIRAHTLACVDIDGEGAVIKRCYPAPTEWMLCSVNVNELEEPMRVAPSSILHVYPLVGVLFELASEQAS